MGPGPEAQSDDEIGAYVRDRASGTIFHSVGTCKMGTDEMAVVDSPLRVHGLDGLRIVDASIMPTLIGGNTNAPTIMIAEKGGGNDAELTGRYSLHGPGGAGHGICAGG